MKKSTCYHGIWYAVMKDSEDDDWSLGSYDLHSAIDILNECGYENGYILKIDETVKTALEVVYEANQSNL